MAVPGESGSPGASRSSGALIGMKRRIRIVMWMRTDQSIVSDQNLERSVFDKKSGIGMY
jgi:hypothetical protein